MPTYRFVVTNGLGAPAFQQRADLAGPGAAWDAGVAICKDLRGDIIEHDSCLAGYELQVYSAEGRLLFCFEFSNIAIVDEEHPQFAH